MSFASRAAISLRVSLFISFSARNLGVGNFHHPIDEDPRGHDDFGVEITQFDEMLGLHNGGLGGHAHDRPEVAGGLAVDQVAPAVCLVGQHQREVAVKGLFEYVVMPVDLAHFLALAELRAIAGARVKAAKPRAGSVQTLSDGALRYTFEFDFAFLVKPVEYVRMRAFRKGANYLANTACLQQGSEPDFVVAGVVGDHGEVAGALIEKGVNQFGRVTCATKAADQDGGTIEYVRDGFVDAIHEFVDHRKSSERAELCVPGRAGHDGGSEGVYQAAALAPPSTEI